MSYNLDRLDQLERAATPAQWFYDQKKESIGYSRGWLFPASDEYREGEGIADNDIDAALVVYLRNEARPIINDLRRFESMNDKNKALLAALNKIAAWDFTEQNRTWSEEFAAVMEFATRTVKEVTR